MKKKVLLFSAGFAMLLGAIFTTQLNAAPYLYGAEILAADECCLNGYKRWDDVNPVESNENFQDCSCNYQRGNDPTSCRCAPSIF